MSGSGGRRRSVSPEVRRRNRSWTAGAESRSGSDLSVAKLSDVARQANEIRFWLMLKRILCLQVCVRSARVLRCLPLLLVLMKGGQCRGVRIFTDLLEGLAARGFGRSLMKWLDGLVAGSEE